MLKKIFVLIGMISWAGWAVAQVNISAHTDKNMLTLDDELTLTVQVTGISGNIIMPQLPSLPAFNVYSREVEQNTINGNTTLLFRYTMLPRFVGNTTIGPIRFTYEGQTYKTEPISIRIYRNNTTATSPSAAKTKTPTPQLDASLPPLEKSLTKQAYAKSSEPFFLVAAVSDTNPYVNQSFILAIRFYYSKAFYEAPYQKPTVSNLFMEEESPREGTQNINGVLYRYQEQRYLLTAAAPGKATIGPASVHYRVGSSPLTAFDRLFGGAAISPEKTALSSPISIQVRELPSGEPSSFYGGVGSGYTLVAQATPQEVQAGEAVNVTVTVKGPGNLKATQNLTFPSMDGFKIYPAAATSGTGTSPTGNLYSYKNFKAVLVPVSSGIYTIPAIKWSYFDLQTASYKTLQTTPISLTVKPTSKSERAFDFSGSSPSTENGIQALTNDIAYLKTTRAPDENLLKKLSRLDTLNWACLLFVCIGILFTVVGRKPLERKKAFVTAKNQLKQADSSQRIAEALSTYLQQKLRIHTGSLPVKEITTQLHQKGVTPATTEAFLFLWQRLEAERFAPADVSTPSAINLPQEALRILKLMEEEIQ